MLDYLIYLIFIISVALAAGGVVISSKMRSTYRHDIFSTLLYYQVFIYIFGFYGIWGQVGIKAFLSAYISADLLNRFSDISMLMGLPFLIFAWLMLMQFSLEISGRKRFKWFASLFLFLNFSILLIIGFIIAREGIERPASMIKYYFIWLNFLYSLTSSLLIMFPGKRLSIIHEHDRKIIVPGIFIIMLLQCSPLIFYTSQVYLAVIFIFTFFAGNTFLPLYLNYGTLLTAFADENKKDLSFEDFCKRFEVSPRETDIVREICNGLSNKEISEKLFISLQTVKDHSHRIYIKTNVKSRVQLINLVKESLVR
jgi:DNA-binding CsgD family transcriptional regulator